MPGQFQQSSWRPDLRGIVMGWTIVTTTFTWTPTMRLLLKPEISHWSVFGIGGSDGSGWSWLLPAVALSAICLFYIEGRGKLRPLFHGLLLAWHVPLAGALVYWSFRLGLDATFMGAAWGVTIPLPVLALPFTIFAVLALVLVIRESLGGPTVPARPWARVDPAKLAVAAALLPLAYMLFQWGEDFDLVTKAAIAATVLQWILLAEALGPGKGRSAYDQTGFPPRLSERNDVSESRP